jgi:hypothetical protein
MQWRARLNDQHHTVSLPRYRQGVGRGKDRRRVEDDQVTLLAEYRNSAAECGGVEKPHSRAYR